MFFEELESLGDDKFRRLTGVKRNTFERCLEILQESERIQKARGGRPNNLSLAIYAQRPEKVKRT